MERKDVTVNLGTARAVAGAGLGGTPPTGDAGAGDGHLGASVASQVVSAICAIGRVADADEVSVDDWSMGCAAWEAINGRRLTETEADEALRLLKKGEA